MDEAPRDAAGRSERATATDGTESDLVSLILAAYFVALILIVVALLVLPAIF